MIQTLTVHRDWKSSYNQTTILKDKEGKIKAIFASSIKQPRWKQKTITVNCWVYNLDWSNTDRHGKKEIYQGINTILIWGVRNSAQKELKNSRKQLKIDSL